MNGRQTNKRKSKITNQESKLYTTLPGQPAVIGLGGNNLLATCEKMDGLLFFFSSGTYNDQLTLKHMLDGAFGDSNSDISSRHNEVRNKIYRILLRLGVSCENIQTHLNRLLTFAIHFYRKKQDLCMRHSQYAM